MAWDKYNEGSGSGGKENKGYVEEGNIKKYLFTSEPTRVRFLTVDEKPEDLMADGHISREEAEDRFFTKVVQDKWVMPYSFWEHQIKEIPGKRYFSTAVCSGRSVCPLCAENDKDRANGIGENKMLSYPVRKRFAVPAYFYELDMVLFVINSEEFFNDIATYINRNGSNSDFEIWKVGKGLATKYKSAYVGPSDGRPIEDQYPAPKDVSMVIDAAELRRRIIGGKPVQAQQTVAQAPQTAAKAETKAETKAPDADDAGSFEVTFGSHKGKTLAQLHSAGEDEYIEFLAKNSAGMVQSKAQAFLSSVR